MAQSHANLTLGITWRQVCWKYQANYKWKKKIFSQPGQRQGLLYMHLSQSLIQYLCDSIILCKNIRMMPQRPNGWRWSKLHVSNFLFKIFINNLNVFFLYIKTCIPFLKNSYFYCYCIYKSFCAVCKVFSSYRILQDSLSTSG